MSPKHPLISHCWGVFSSIPVSSIPYKKNCVGMDGIGAKPPNPPSRSLIDWNDWERLGMDGNGWINPPQQWLAKSTNRPQPNQGKRA